MSMIMVEARKASLRDRPSDPDREYSAKPISRGQTTEVILSKAPQQERPAEEVLPGAQPKAWPERVDFSGRVEWRPLEAPAQLARKKAVRSEGLRSRSGRPTLQRETINPPPDKTSAEPVLGGQTTEVILSEAPPLAWHAKDALLGA
jgi:hypothetical protein